MDDSQFTLPGSGTLAALNDVITISVPAGYISATGVITIRGTLKGTVSFTSTLTSAAYTPITLNGINTATGSSITLNSGNVGSYQFYLPGMVGNSTGNVKITLTAYTSGSAVVEWSLPARTDNPLDLHANQHRPNGPDELTNPDTRLAVATPKNPVVTITTFQSGHGWTQSGTGTVNLNDTTDYVLGSQSAWMMTDGSASNAQSIRITGATAADFSAKNIRVWLKCDDWSKISQLQLYVGDTAFTNFRIARIGDDLYNVANSQYLKNGEWGVIDLSWADVVLSTGVITRSALTAWQLRAVDNGTATKIHINGIVGVPDMSPVFPNGVVSFWFDDGWASQYTEARKKLDQYGYPATACPIVDKIDSGAGWMTLAQLKLLEKYSGWEIGAHAYNTYSHDAGFDTLSDTQLHAEFSANKTWLLQNKFKAADLLAYPLGAFTVNTADIASRYFSLARTVNGTRFETIPPQNPLRAMTRIGLGNSTATGTVTGHIDSAYAGQGWLIIYGHDIATPASASTQFTIANFATVVDYCSTKGIPVRTVGDVLRSSLRL